MKKAWFVFQSQIADGDIDGVILPVDPEQIPDAEIYGLHGAVRLRVENTAGPAGIFMNPLRRKFFRDLHQRWPWAGYFLRLTPLKRTSTQNHIIDLGTFMALALCHCDSLGYCESKQGCVLRYGAGELGEILAEFQGRAAELAQSVGIPDDTIRQRDELITDSVVSFFAAGKAVYQRNKRGKRK
jgi:hypothetical protein